MEDILASIRRIIADDQGQGRAPASSQRRIGGTPLAGTPAARPRDERSEAEDVLDLARIRTTEADAPRAAALRPEAPQPNGRDGSSWSSREQYTVPPRPAPMEPRAVEDADAVDVTSLGDADSLGPNGGSRAEARQIEAYSHNLGAGDDDGEETLLSPKPSASVLSAFETLAATVVLQNQEMLERIMRDEMRPMVKTWLDDNLPTVVERLIRAEIERVARGPRG